MSTKLQLTHLLFILLCYCCCLFNTHTTQAATEYNRYLAHIFQKYGNGGTMSFEGLEHLMYSLGLGQIVFEPTHTIDEHRPKNDDKINIKLDGNKNEIIQLTSKKVNENNKNIADDQIQPGVLERHTAMANDEGGENKKIQNSNININNDAIKLADDVDVLVKDHYLRENGVILEFKEMHDPKHRHPRENDATFDGPPITANVCLSPKSLLRLVVDHDDLHKRKLYKTVFATATANSRNTNNNNNDDDDHDADADDDDDDVVGMPAGSHNFEEEYNDFVNSVKLTPLAFMKLCPALLAQIDQHVCAQPAPLTHGEDPKELLWNAWIYASGSIFILSACGLFGILLVPLMKTVAYQEILKFLVAVAVGTLSGDALMHLLPHALVKEHADDAEPTPMVDKQQHSHDNTPVWICACAFGTAIFMYILEKLLPFLKGETEEGGHHGHSHGGHGHSHGGHSHAHGHGHGHAAHEHSHAAQDRANTTVAVEAKEINVMLNELKKDKKSPSRPLTPVAFMVVIGDGLHNLTDGLAIGAAFATDPVTGMATAFAVLCHELPHELGDFALLLQTGVSLKRAVCLNIVSSVLSFLGMAIGLLIAGIHTNMTQWIYAGTAGSFLYIAFADLVPAMSADAKRDLKGTLIQIFGMIVGGIIMLVIAVNEDQLEALFK